MGVVWRYWTHVRLQMSGELRKSEVVAAKLFFQQQFPDWADAITVPDRLVQQQLVALMRPLDRSLAALERARLAECCLRCYVSNQIPQVCFGLMQRFKLQAGLQWGNLLPYILNDLDPLQPQAVHTPFQPLAIRVVQTFDPEQSHLSTWTKRLVLQQKSLIAVLAEHGIYLASSWAILSHTSPARMRRLLAGMLATPELERASLLLESYHAVYRHDRVQRQSTQVGRRCKEPSHEQLQRMVQYLQAQGAKDDGPGRVLQELRLLAEKLRQVKRMPTVSLDDETTGFLAYQHLSRSAPSEDEQDEFLSHYYRAAEQCLYQAVHQVLEERLADLRQQKNPKDQVFLKALALFHQQRQSMAQIAPQVGLSKQFQVTRLLGLKQLRLAVRQTWLKQMRERLPQLLANYLEPNQIERLERLDVLLEEYIDRILAADASESYSPYRNSSSMFTVCLCQYLELRSTNGSGYTNKKP
ncbi:hypothetical protein HJG54_30700 [Leptolyngbya sp. NK1-12]|uniref:Uncharacterized protein n=1 Tax=Leptolyngbya sp. NK1-12 TaxID=2547451 RepID=A0AA96WJV6_9CYAN|nr:hypothetical protein [Leptolyngbya sp. NK1-12]WNZ27262.1 hypothetical protein HJG54_30700 [Leptolyngbya sp. NK1-12]